MRILIIEDNPGDARLVHELLKEAAGFKDFEIRVVETLKSGLDLLASQEVAAVLLDLGLPDSRGLETLTRLHAQFPRLPVVIMTGSDSEALGVEAVQLGAQDYLVKGQADGRLLRRSLMYAMERKKSDETLKEKEQLLERMAELNPAIISVADLTNNHQIYSSKPSLAPLVLLGYKPEDIRDVSAFSASILYPGDLEKMIAAVAELKEANDDRTREIDVRARDAQGKWRWFQILYVIFKRTPEGLPLQSMSVARDVTEGREAEEELRRRTQELEIVNKELEAFSYSVSHDLRAPLRRLDGFSSILLEDYGDKFDSHFRECLGRIRSSSQLMDQLIDDMLRLSRIGRAEMELKNVDLSELAESIAEGLKQAEPERKAEFIVQPGICGWGDRPLLKIVLQNLLDNAWKYTSRVETARIGFGAEERNGERIYAITDNGVGFDMARAGELFQPFRRLHSEEEYPGSGIGLAIVQRVISRHAGRVWAEAKVGEGANFYFTLGKGWPST